MWLRPTVHKKYLSGAGIGTKLFWMGSRADSDVDRPQEPSLANSFFKNWCVAGGHSCIVTSITIQVRNGANAACSTLTCRPLVLHLSGTLHPPRKCMYAGGVQAFAIYGWMQVREGLEPVNLLVEDSYAIPHYRVLEKYFWHHGPSVQIVVNNPPDMRSAEERVRLRITILGIFEYFCFKNSTLTRKHAKLLKITYLSQQSPSSKEVHLVNSHKCPRKLNSKFLHHVQIAAQSNRLVVFEEN